MVLRALGLGDLLTAVPALRAVRRALPAHDVSLATPAALAPLVRLGGLADRVLPTSGLDEPLRLTGVDVAVNLHGCGPQSHRLLRSLRPRRLVGFGCLEAAETGPPWRSDEHEVARWCRLVSEALEVAADPGDLRLPAPAGPAAARADVDGAVVVHPGAAHPARRWPAARFAQVARWAHERGHVVVVTGTRAEADIAAMVCVLAGLDPSTAQVAGRTSLLDLARLVAHARLVVCGDTGVAHLATAFGTRSVVLFGPTPPERWGPPTDARHHVIWHGHGVDDPFAPAPHPALLQITAPDVIVAADRLLADDHPSPVSSANCGIPRAPEAVDGRKSRN